MFYSPACQAGGAWSGPGFCLGFAENDTQQPDCLPSSFQRMAIMNFQLVAIPSPATPTNPSPWEWATACASEEAVGLLQGELERLD
jgi:hypothetical protein